jgi:hypothetical protein
MSRFVFILGAVLLVLGLYEFWPRPPLDRLDPVGLERIVKDHFRHVLVHPEDARWDFTTIAHYRFGGEIVCGTVDFKNSAQKYIGAHVFYAIIQNGAYHEGGLVGDTFEDPTGSFAFTAKIACKQVITN